MNTTISSRPKVALIAGPTASGKSELAIRVAEAHDGVVINADSAQVYTDLHILSARPNSKDEARAPHRLFGHVDGAEAYSAARWANEARLQIELASKAGKLPILVGGTGLYFRTLLDGIAPVPEIDPTIRAQIRALPVAEAHAKLYVQDPAAAERLAPADTARVARALEVITSTGRTLADWQAHRVGGIGRDIDLAALVLLPDRQWLMARCDARFAEMAERGAVDEVRDLLARQLNPALPVMRAIGVAQFACMLSGDATVAGALERGRLATRQYAKRQYTWFRNQSPPNWTRTPATETAVRQRLFETILHR